MTGKATVTPFIIWTVQRTGGTNFATNLIKLSGLPIIEHEPLNIGRAFGHISEEWKYNNNKIQLRENIISFLNQGHAIKHCVETVDFEVTKSLALESSAKGFRHIILYRENSIDRLLSLHFATETGFWGRKKVLSAKKKAGENFVDATSINKIDPIPLIEHEKYCRECLTKVSRILHEKGCDAYTVSFEEIYDSDLNYAEEKISNVIGYIGLTTDPRKFLQRIRISGEQGSKDIYKKLEGYHKFSEQMKEIDRFTMGYN